MNTCAGVLWDFPAISPITFDDTASSMLQSGQTTGAVRNSSISTIPKKDNNNKNSMINDSNNDDDDDHHHHHHHVHHVHRFHNDEDLFYLSGPITRSFSDSTEMNYMILVVSLAIFYMYVYVCLLFVTGSPFSRWTWPMGSPCFRMGWDDICLKDFRHRLHRRRPGMLEVLMAGWKAISNG